MGEDDTKETLPTPVWMHSMLGRDGSTDLARVGRADTDPAARAPGQEEEEGQCLDLEVEEKSAGGGGRAAAPQDNMRTAAHATSTGHGAGGAGPPELRLSAARIINMGGP